MNHFVVEDWVVSVPDWVTDLESFRRWADDDDFPEKGKISYLRGAVWVDLSVEQLFSHNLVKTEFTVVLGGLVKSARLGLYFSDGAYVSNVEADVSNQPDGTFVSLEALRSGRVKVIEGRDEGFVELEGSPDMVLEVVSRSSVTKDTKVLREAYFRAGVREYWLVDARKPPATFEILRAGKSGFVAGRRRGGWVRSEVFDAGFRLACETGENGHPVFSLECQPPTSA